MKLWVGEIEHRLCLFFEFWDLRRNEINSLNLMVRWLPWRRACSGYVKAETSLGLNWCEGLVCFLWFDLNHNLLNHLIVHPENCALKYLFLCDAESLNGARSTPILCSNQSLDIKFFCAETGKGGYCRHGSHCNRAHGFRELRIWESFILTTWLSELTDVEDYFSDEIISFHDQYLQLCSSSDHGSSNLTSKLCIQVLGCSPASPNIKHGYKRSETGTWMTST